jgi:hypothetical protein
MSQSNAPQLDPGQQALGAAHAQLLRIADDGSARHSYLNNLFDCSGPHAGRDLADAIHLLCHVHGKHPGLVELALQRAPKGKQRDWLERADESFERERLYLVRLTSAVGPVPSTPGATQCESALVATRHALETLATSERDGCSLGAITALVGDWWPIRRLLDRAASRAGVDCPAPSLPDENAVMSAIDEVAQNPSSARALAFGGQQLLLQHRGLFDLLEARALARGDFSAASRCSAWLFAGADTVTETSAICDFALGKSKREPSTTTPSAR